MAVRLALPGWTNPEMKHVLAARIAGDTESWQTQSL